jgi:hypothetical protein
VRRWNPENVTDVLELWTVGTSPPAGEPNREGRIGVPGASSRKDATMPNSNRLPTRFPAGSKYVLEGWGSVVHRYVELPGGRRIMLRQRKAVACRHLTLPELSIVPGAGTAVSSEPAGKKPADVARRRARMLEPA